MNSAARVIAAAYGGSSASDPPSPSLEELCFLEEAIEHAWAPLPVPWRWWWCTRRLDLRAYVLRELFPEMSEQAALWAVFMSVPDEENLAVLMRERYVRTLEAGCTR